MSEESREKKEQISKAVAAAAAQMAEQRARLMAMFEPLLPSDALEPIFKRLDLKDAQLLDEFKPFTSPDYSEIVDGEKSSRWISEGDRD